LIKRSKTKNMFMIEYNGNGLMEEMMKEELMDGGTMVNHDT